MRIPAEDGQPYLKSAPSAGSFAMRRHTSTVGIHDLPRKMNADAEAVGKMVSRSVAARKQVEQVPCFLIVETDAGVNHDYSYPPILERHFQLDGGTGVRIGRGIGQQTGDGLLKPAAVGFHRHRFLWQLDYQPLPSFSDLR